MAEGVHHIAAQLHQQNAQLYNKTTRNNDGGQDDGTASDPELTVDQITQWYKPREGPLAHLYPVILPWPTLFAHPRFVSHEQYPSGTADIVGYWAEDRILGGVVLFDHSNQNDVNGSQRALGSPIYFDSCRCDRAGVIFQLTDEQESRLLRFLAGDEEADATSDAESRNYPLPLLYEHNQATRLVDPEFAVVKDQIYRDSWERPPPREQLPLDRRFDGDGDAELQRLRDQGFLQDE